MHLRAHHIAAGFLAHRRYVYVSSPSPDRFQVQALELHVFGLLIVSIIKILALVWKPHLSAKAAQILAKPANLRFSASIQCLMCPMF